ncbi:MAG: hypothetical protein V3S89_08830 [Desulfobacterales bacterium]
MVEATKDILGERSIWTLIGIVFFCVFLVLIIVLSQNRGKPKSAHEFVAAAFNQGITTLEWKPGMGPKPLVYHPAGFNQTDRGMFTTQEWKPGMGPKPLMYHPAALNQLGWQSLPARSGQAVGQVYQAPQPAAQGTDGQWRPYTPGGNGGGLVYQPNQP